MGFDSNGTDLGVVLDNQSSTDPRTTAAFRKWPNVLVCVCACVCMSLMDAIGHSCQRSHDVCSSFRLRDRVIPVPDSYSLLAFCPRPSWPCGSVSTSLLLYNLQEPRVRVENPDVIPNKSGSTGSGYIIWVHPVVESIGINRTQFSSPYTARLQAPLPV